MGRPLVDGIYEHLVTDELAEALAELEASRRRLLEQVSDADGPLILARHVGAELQRVLEALAQKGRAERSRELAGRLLERLAELAREAGVDDAEAVHGQRVPAPARRLLAVHRAAAPARPSTPLSVSTLLTRNHAEPAIGHELAREIATADRIDVLIAFITVGGIRRVREQLEDFARRGGRMRVLTTTFTGTTERRALDFLAGLPGAEVKVSYDVRRTRLHAKAWLFHRDTGLSTAYVGSANLTAAALGDGHEWMMKACAADLPHVLDKFQGAFDTLWLDPEFEPYDPRDEGQRVRLQEALDSEGRPDELTTLVTLRPYPFQEEILDRLAAERRLHGRTRNLVVAATGTGKTVIAAFDYARLAAETGVRPRLLFLAHRKEILRQARDTFRHVLKDGAFGELSVGGQEPARFEHVFASIQGAGRLVERVGREHFRHVVIDECHHMPAESYQAVLAGLAPDLLVGLTATPERGDGRSLLPDFDDHIAAELRLWHALERQLLVPFDYYGVSDGLDLRRVRWSRSGYDLAALAELYTGHEARAELVLAQLERRVADVRRVRALGFCVSVEHAEFMAASFSRRGLPARAVHGKTPAPEREDAMRRLREREVNVLFTCDLYNEGVDMPFVDTLLLLRPTMSATLFLQQLGRGLRHDEASGKRACLVLDFIGQHRAEFRFDAVMSALSGVPRGRLQKAVEQDFPFLPSGCSLQLDAVARETILRSLRGSIASARRLAQELREVAGRRGAEVSLQTFLDDTGREIEEIYDGKSRSWGILRGRAGLAPELDEESADLSRRLGWLAHIDEPRRLATYAAAARGERDAMDAAARRRWAMLDYQLNHRGVLRAAEEAVEYVSSRPAIAGELQELCDVLGDRVALAADTYPVPGWPLALHRHYARREIVAAVGFVAPGDKGKLPQGGILRLAQERRELLFVTLDKSGSGFSPTTRYRDYAISRDLFHWETQSAASVSRPSGRRYLDSPGNGWTFYLFVRADPESAYAFLGPVRYVSHTGDRPIAITWRLEHALPAALYERYATLASP